MTYKEKIEATCVITGPNTRWSYCNLFKPKSTNGGKLKYKGALPDWAKGLSLRAEGFESNYYRKD